MFSHVLQSCYRNSCNLNTMTYGLLCLVPKWHLLSCDSVFEALLWQGMGYMYLSPTCIISEFQNLSFCPLRRNCLMSLLVFFTICTCLCPYFCHCYNFNPSFCLSLPFCLFCVAVSRSCHLSEL